MQFNAKCDIHVKGYILVLYMKTYVFWVVALWSGANDEAREILGGVASTTSP